MLTRSPDKVYPSGTSESSGKKRTSVWGHKAPKQLTPLFSQPSPQHTLTERLFSLRIRSGDTLPLGPPCCLPPSTSQSLEPRPAPPHTLARHLPLRGRALGSWPRGLGQKYNLPRSALRVLQSPGDRRTRQARGPHGIQGTRRRTPGHLSSTFQSYPTNSVTQAVRVSTCHWSELPLTPLPYTSFPKPRACPRL